MGYFITLCNLVAMLSLNNWAKNKTKKNLIWLFPDKPHWKALLDERGSAFHSETERVRERDSASLSLNKRGKNKVCLPQSFQSWTAVLCKWGNLWQCVASLMKTAPGLWLLAQVWLVTEPRCVGSPSPLQGSNACRHFLCNSTLFGCCCFCCYN